METRNYTVHNGSQYETVTLAAESAGLKAEVTDYKTKIALTGTKEQFAKFDKLF